MSSPSTDRDDYFAYGPGDLVLSQCAVCEHLSTGEYLACKAFPGEIPQEIVANEFDHRKPWIDPATGIPGDRGVALTDSVLFSPRPGTPGEVLAAIDRHFRAAATGS